MGRALLVLGATVSGSIALLHVAIATIGGPAYRYFGAGDALAPRAEAGSWVPAGVTVAIAAVFGAFAAYGLAGAKIVRPLPFTRAGLVCIASIYLIRGLAAVPEALTVMGGTGALPVRFVVFSCVALLAGLSYGFGALSTWRLTALADRPAQLAPPRAGGRDG